MRASPRARDAPRRFKDEVREAQEGHECGTAFENYQDIRIENFGVESVQRAV